MVISRGVSLVYATRVATRGGRSLKKSHTLAGVSHISAGQLQAFHLLVRFMVRQTSVPADLGDRKDMSANTWSAPA